MDIYKYIGDNVAQVEEYAIQIRRWLCAAYVETNGYETFLVTNYPVNSTNFRYFGRK